MPTWLKQLVAILANWLVGIIFKAKALVTRAPKVQEITAKEIMRPLAADADDPVKRAARRAKMLGRHRELTATDFDWYSGRVKDYRVEMLRTFNDLFKHGHDAIDASDLDLLISDLEKILLDLKNEQASRV